jgi:glycosyltransferase involved in cell wall biosynthesis
LKVGILFAGDFEEGNGANARLKAYAKGLKELGEQVEILILHASSFNRTKINKKTAGEWEGIPFRYLNRKCYRPEKILAKAWDTLRTILLSSLFIIKNYKQYDVLYLYSPKPHQVFNIYLLAKLLKIPLVVEMTERYSTAYEHSGFFDLSIFKKLHLWHERNIHKLCDHLVVISKQLYGYFQQKISSNRLSLIPIVIDMNRFSHLNGKPKKPLRVGYIGSFGQKDGVLEIIQAYQDAKRKYPDLRLSLIGYPENLSKDILQDLYKSDKDIEFTGQVYYQNIPDHLHNCDLLIVNRPNTAYANYGFPTKLGEYLASGRPVIATNVGDISYYLEDENDLILVEPDNTKQLAEAIIQRYKWYDYYTQVGLQGAKSAYKRFDYLMHTQELLKVFYKTAGKLPPRGLKQNQKFLGPNYGNSKEANESERNKNAEIAKN